MKSYFIIVLFYIILQSNGDGTPGHGKELGLHRVSEGHIAEVEEVPTPEEFWLKYARKRTPVVFRGAAKDFPAYHLWTDDYLAQHYGDLEVKLEAKREKNRTPTGERGLGRDTIRSYLHNYKWKDSYVVSQLPDPMAKEVNVLSCLSCGSFADHILEANLWLSSGGTSSLLHRDADNAINCLLNGTKDWILINPAHEDKIPIAKGDRGYGGFAVLDVNSVNLIKYPDFKHVPWQFANVTPGDCLFLPYGYWHQVRSHGPKNMAYSVLFSRLKQFSPLGCDSAEYAPFPLSESSMVWTYSGHGPQTLGNADPFELRDMLADVVHYSEKMNQTFDSSAIYKLLTENGLMDDGEEAEMAEMIYRALNNFTNGDINESHIKNLTVEQLKSLVLYMDGDPANTEEYENVLFSPEEIRETIKKAIAIDHGRMKLNTLLQLHTNLGGSEKMAHELFSQLDLNDDGVVQETEVNQEIGKVLTMFEKEKDDDLSFQYYMDELSKDRKMMEKMTGKHYEL